MPNNEWEKELPKWARKMSKKRFVALGHIFLSALEQARREEREKASKVLNHMNAPRENSESNKWCNGYNTAIGDLKERLGFSIGSSPTSITRNEETQ